MHVAIHLDMLHHHVAVRLQSAVEIMKILYAAYLACRGIEELRRNRLRERVIAFLLPTRHEIIAILLDHAV